jgi:hypothetical protein
VVGLLERQHRKKAKQPSLAEATLLLLSFFDPLATLATSSSLKGANFHSLAAEQQANHQEDGEPCFHPSSRIDLDVAYKRYQSIDA